MPLPDERPRASVANLIGRFEQQNKKTAQAGTGSVISRRSSSVISNITGDSAKEAVKEKREWPPKPASSSVETPAPIKATPFTSNTGPYVSAAVPDTNNKPAVLASETSASPPSVAETVPTPIVTNDPQNAQKDRPSKEDIHTTEKTPKSPKAQSASVTKSPPPSSFRTPSKPPAKSGSRIVSNTASTPALRPQHTGQSTTSTSTRKSTTPRTAPSTPSRPKTSSGTPSGSLREKKPISTARSKTPTPSKTPPSHAIPPRAKTPSSNLFAPTAASLAKSRNASAEVASPTRKVTLSSSAADRLSKPTASSLSKARSPPPTIQARSSSNRGVSKPAQRGAKPEVTATTKGDVAEKSVTGDAKSSIGMSATANGHHVGTVSTTPGDETRFPEDDVVQETPQQETEAVVHDQGEQAAESEYAGEESTTGIVSPEQHDLSLGTGESEDDRNTTPVNLEASNIGGKEVENESHELTTQVSTDIEDMVNLLEYKARPVSMVNIPDEVNEIPDED